MSTSVTVAVSNPAKALFPDGMTKRDLARYYERVADAMLPLVRGRPVHMQRFPDGIEGREIQQKQAPAYFPDFVTRVRVPRKRGGSVDHVVIDKPETLVYLVDQACITPHVWLSRSDRLEQPDRLIFDLDPPHPDPRVLRQGARALRSLLEEVDLSAYLMTTGSRGLHVVAPLDRCAGFDETRALARSLAQLLVARHPERFTLEQRKNRRGERLYLDTARNGYAQTAVAPYAVRALPGAPVATPLAWDELSRSGPQRFTARNVPSRLARRGDPWADIDRHAASASDARATLAQLSAP